MKNRKRVAVIAVTAIFGLLMRVSAWAVGFGLSASSGSVAPNGTFTVTISGARGLFQITTENGSAPASTMCGMSGGCSFQVTAGSAGTTRVTVSPIDAATSSTTPEEVNESRSVSVAITSPNNNTTGSRPSGNTQKPAETDHRSTNNALASLGVSKGTLQPAFSPEVTEYKISLPSDATEIEVDAQAADAKASVSGIGKKALKAGDNVLEIICTAENQTTKTYRIIVDVDEKPLVFVKYQGKKLGFVRNVDDVSIPSGFTAKTISVNGESVSAWEREEPKQTLVYLVDDDNHKDFYLYDEKEGVTSLYRPIQLGGRNFVMIDVPKKLQKQSGLTYQRFTLEEMSFYGWKYENQALENYYVLYLMDGKGNTAFYQYEASEQTLQLYNGNVATQEQLSEEQARGDQAMLWCYGTAGVAGVLLLALGGFVYYVKKGKK